jgi:cell wall-associated NlpC family hydrolase
VSARGGNGSRRLTRDDWAQPDTGHGSALADLVRTFPLRRGPEQRHRFAAIAVLATGTLATSMTGFAAATSGSPVDIQPPPDPVTQASMLGARQPPAAAARGTTLAAEIAGPSSSFTALSIAPDRSTISPNDEVTFTIHASEAATAAPVADEQVNVVVVTGTRWSTSAILRTDRGGDARISARLLSTTTITAVFDGSDVLRPAVAGATTVTVRSLSSALTGVAGSGRVGVLTATSIPGSTIGAKAVYLASLQKGKPYVYGAAGPYSFDCSGFAQYVYRQLGRYLPRTAQQQFNSTIRVPQSAKQPGDLIFFGTPDNIYHMGIYAGNGYMWAAPRTGDVVKYEPIYSSRYYVGRVL